MYKCASIMSVLVSLVLGHSWGQRWTKEIKFGSVPKLRASLGPRGLTFRPLWDVMARTTLFFGPPRSGSQDIRSLPLSELIYVPIREKVYGRRSQLLKSMFRWFLVLGCQLKPKKQYPSLKIFRTCKQAQCEWNRRYGSQSFRVGMTSEDMIFKKLL